MSVRMSPDHRKIRSSIVTERDALWPCIRLVMESFQCQPDPGSVNDVNLRNELLVL